MTEISLQSLKKNPRYHSNMAKLSGFNAIMVIFKIFSILIENETVKCEEKKKWEPPNVTKELSHVMLELHNVRIELSNVRI